jgi:SH3-like domain-containing protein
MKNNNFCLLLSVSFLTVMAFVPSLPAFAAETADYEVVPCDRVLAFVYDTDPAGLNVRSGPGSDYPVIATLPTNQPVELLITGAVGAWMRITEPSGQTFDTMNIVGWVYGPLLAVWTQGNPSGIPLHTKPSASSPILAKIPNGITVSITGCQGEWLKVKYREIEGWLDPTDQCGAFITSCS